MPVNIHYSVKSSVNLFKTWNCLQTAHTTQHNSNVYVNHRHTLLLGERQGKMSAHAH